MNETIKEHEILEQILGRESDVRNLTLKQVKKVMDSLIEQDIKAAYTLFVMGSDPGYDWRKRSSKIKGLNVRDPKQALFIDCMARAYELGHWLHMLPYNEDPLYRKGNSIVAL